MGSPLYMSPEQMRSAKNVDERTDIWALGVILYELLTGRVPFDAESMPELCLKVVQDQPDSPKSLRPEIAEGLSAVVLKCLEKDAKNRFANVAELAASLEPYSDVARGSSERIASTLNLPSRPPMVSISSFSSSGSNPKIGTGGTAWGTTQALEAKKKQRTPIMVGGAVVGLVVLTVGIGLAMKSSSTPKNETQTAATQPTQTTATATATQTVTAPPTVWEPMTSVATTSATTATTTATATQATTARGQAKPPGSAKATSTATSTSKTSPTVTAPPKNFE